MPQQEAVNVRPRGWCVIDAKGVLGDPAYDLAILPNLLAAAGRA